MKYNWKVLALVGFLSGATTLAGYKVFIQDNPNEVVLKDASEAPLARFTSGGAAGPVDFTTAAEVSTPVVVHIKSTAVRQQGSSRQQQQGWPFDMFDFFGDGSGSYDQSPRRSEGTGSGVIISNDGYIVTNNHVVESAQEIEVTLHDKTKLKAKLVGTDPSTDIAVIKVESKNLPSITFGDSDGIRVGEWVVAVGNPFNLESTVTAGIVSAKGRGLGIIGSSQSRQRGRGQQGQQQQFNDAIESFIQTDAVVNPGNSGGALVNLRGELVGINTAIASPTGSFAGYAFAVPSSIVKKVSTDLIKFGNAQRGYLGIVMQEVDNTVAEEKDLKVSSGILIRELAESSSAAGDAGIKPGDVIVKINGKKIGSTPELTQTVGLLRPGDKINVTVNRDGKERDFNVTLKNREGGSGVIKREESAALALEVLGAQFTNLNDAEKKKLERYNIKGGVKITDVQGGKLARVGVAPGFIITKVNSKPVTSVKELEKELAGKADSMVQFEGLELDAPYDVYSFGFRL